MMSDFRGSLTIMDGPDQHFSVQPWWTKEDNSKVILYRICFVILYNSLQELGMRDSTNITFCVREQSTYPSNHCSITTAIIRVQDDRLDTTTIAGTTCVYYNS